MLYTEEVPPVTLDTDRERYDCIRRSSEAAVNLNTSALFVQPSVFLGAARLFDFAGSLNRRLYNCSPTPEEADIWAMQRDWLAVGDDFRTVLSIKFPVTPKAK